MTEITRSLQDGIVWCLSMSVSQHGDKLADGSVSVISGPSGGDKVHSLLLSVPRACSIQKHK